MTTKPDPLRGPLVVDTETGRVGRATDADAAGAPFIICTLLTDPLILPDNEAGFCSWCNTRIQFRPGLPPGPHKICSPCGVIRLRNKEH